MINSEKSLLGPMDRVGKKMSISEFKDLMLKEINRLGGLINYSNPKPSENYIYINSLLSGLSNNGLWKDFTKSLGVEVSPTNIEVDEKGLGFCIAPNGMPYFGALWNEDCNPSVFVIIYYDGEKFKGYVPLYGNNVNLDFMIALGDEEEQMVSTKGGRRIWDDYCRKGIIPNYIKDLVDNEEDCYLEYYLPVGYVRKYGYLFEEKEDLEDLKPNLNLCKLDILSRFKVI